MEQPTLLRTSAAVSYPGSSLQRDVLLIAALAALALLPTYTSSYGLKIATEVLIYGILTMSLDLLLGYTGLPSLGHAAFFGLGAYGAAVIGKRLSVSLLVTLPAAVIVAAIGALIIGALVLRSRGIYFLMLTVAFGQMVFAVAYRWKSITGGPDGLVGVSRPRLGSLSFNSSINFYLLTLVIFALVYLVLKRIVASPFGKALAGVRDNEQRLRALGFDTYKLKLKAFVIAGAAAGAAGALAAYMNRFVSPGQTDWSVSALILVMAIIGGAGTLIGPVFGALAFMLIQNSLSSYSEYWHLYLGALFIIAVLTMPRGLAGLWTSLVQRRRKGAQEDAA